MNRDVFKGRWRRFRGRVLVAWGGVADDADAVVRGERDIVTGEILIQYGEERAAAVRALDGALARARAVAPEPPLSPIARAAGR
jgi:uncharacterized protein YjbJ (UPF0337 family)